MRPIATLTTTLTALALASLPATVRLARAEPAVLHVDPGVEDCEVRFAPELTQASYARFVREFGSVAAFKQMGSPLVLAPRGVAVGVEYMAFSIDEHADAWNDTFTHPDAEHELGSDKQFPKLKLRVGVGRDTEVGAFFDMNPISNYGWIGIDGKHAFLRQGPAMPVTVSGRAAYTKTLFVDDMDMHALTADVSIGRTWDRVTPYLGVGTDAVLARETAPTVELDTEYAVTPHAFAGVEVSVYRLRLGAEAQLAVVPSAQAQATWTF